MSLMSDTQGTPERVWALVRLIAAQGGQMPRDEVRYWLDPLHSAESATAVAQTVGAASSLELVQYDTATKSLTLGINNVPGDQLDFSDWVHERLVGLPEIYPDAVVLKAFAWFVANSAKKQGMTWMNGRANKDIADSIRGDLGDDSEGSTFNVTRYPRWRDWIIFLGLGYDVPLKGGSVFYPYVVDRMRRIKDKLFQDLDVDEEIDAETFVGRLSKLMPYLDGGVLFTDIAKRIGWPPSPTRLSPVTSTALRELHGHGVLKLQVFGDARDTWSLSHDPTQKIQAFRGVIPGVRDESNG